MWLVISLLLALAALAILSAGLLWPLIDPSNPYTVAGHRWYLPWWHFWLKVCQPLLSWRHQQYLQQLVGQLGLNAQLAVVYFAWQCLAVLVSVLVGVGWVWFMHWNAGTLLVVAAGVIVAYWGPVAHLKQQITHHKKHMQQQFPFMLDLLILGLESGMGLQPALYLCAHELPVGTLQKQLLITLEVLRTGTPKEQAFTQFAQQLALDEAYAFVAALQQSFELGGQLAPLLRQQSIRRRQERFLRAEKKALEAPVKMLLPLVVCIFPCTFLVIGYPLFFQLWQNL